MTSPTPDPAVFVHETAVVEAGAIVGAGTKVWHHGHLRSGARVGRDCVLGKNVFVDDGAVVGDRTHIQNNVSVYAGVELGDDVFVGPSAVFTNDRVPRAGSSTWQLARTVVHDGASVGANATIVAGIEIGAAALVAAGAVVLRAVAAHEVVGGNPARRLGWVCTCGATRVAVDASSVICPTCGTHPVGTEP